MTIKKTNIVVSSDPQKDWIFMKTKAGKEEKFHWDDILYLEAKGDYTNIVTTRGSYLKPFRIGELIERLGHPTMVKCHRSYVVNPNKIEQLKWDCIIMAGQEIPVSKKYRKAIFSQLHDRATV